MKKRSYLKRADDKFKECVHWISLPDGTVIHCNYATADMNEDTCPNCKSRLVRAY